MFTTEDVAEYYNTTQNHYERWWKLRDHLSLHYGIWNEKTRNFSEALHNTNNLMLEMSKINAKDHVLDAGCGVGGAALHIANNTDANVTGITLSDRQYSYAIDQVKNRLSRGNVQFEVMDYCNTSYKDESFDVIWACESISSAIDKADFLKEAFRLLRKGGRLILTDFFVTSKNQQDQHSYVDKWIHTWGISELLSNSNFINLLEDHNFQIAQNVNYTESIKKTASKLYVASIFGSIGSEIYNVFNRGTSRFAKKHYQCGYYQYKALKAGLWEYHMILATK